MFQNNVRVHIGLHLAAWLWAFVLILLLPLALSKFDDDRWIMNVWSATNYSVKGDQFGFQLLSHMETQWLAKNMFDRGWVEPRFIAQTRDNAVYEDLIRRGTMKPDFAKILGTDPVACEELFECSWFADYHDRFLLSSDLDNSGLQIDHLIVSHPGNIGGQACADVSADEHGSRFMEFFGERFFVKRVTCIWRIDSSYISTLLNAIEEDEQLVALAVGRTSINAFTQSDPSHFGKELWADATTVLGLPSDFPRILAQLQPSARIAAMGEQIENALGRPFLSTHWRRGDRGHPEMGSYGQQMWELSEPENMACILNDIIAETGVASVFVATNSGTPHDRERLRTLVRGRVVFFADVFPPKRNSNTHELDALVAEMFLCRRAEAFLAAGNSHWRASTISRIVTRLFDMDRRGVVYYLWDCDPAAHLAQLESQREL